MKTSRLLLAIPLFATSLLSAAGAPGSAVVDSYFKSPSLVAGQVTMAPLHDFFDYEQHTRNGKTAEDKNAFFCRGMSLFINKVYNSSEYAEHLSQDATHITELLHLASDYGLGQEAVYTGLRLFHNKLKGADIIDDTAVSHMLQEFPALLEKFFKADEPALDKPVSLHSPSKVMENILLAEFTEHLQQPKVPLDTFFSGLAKKMASSVPQQKPQEADQQMMRERLRNQVVTFLENAIGNTMWYPQNYEGIWESVTSMAHNIHMLGANGVLNHMDDADNLLWSLVHRFGFFLDQYGAQLPRSFFAGIREAIEQKQVFFLNSPELDEGIKSKKDTLLDALTRAEAKSVAFKHGIISDVMPERHSPHSSPKLAVISGGFSNDIAQELESIQQGPPPLYVG